MTREGAMDIGSPPPEPPPPVSEPAAPVKEDLKTRALRKWQEDQMREKQAQDALEGFGSMANKHGFCVANPVVLDGGAPCNVFYREGDALSCDTEAGKLSWFNLLAADADPGDEA